jgi:hypothetical protein
MQPHIEKFTLGCDPTSGTLPLGARVCRDIAQHQQAMLSPRKPRSTCGGSPFMPTVDVVVVHGGAGGFTASPGCGWPGGTPASIYFAAAIRDASSLHLLEPRLRCEDNPSFFATPTPWSSINACVRGLWTKAAEQAIRAAKSAPEITNLPARLFPADPGVRRCRIPAGGPRRKGGNFTAGLCGVSLTGPASSKTVHFTESWNVGARLRRHHWILRGTTLIGQSGATPPQWWS